MAQPVVTEWRAESVRFTFFFDEKDRGRFNSNLWNAITGAEPQSTTNVHATGVKHDQGMFLGGQLNVATAATRVDVILSAVFGGLDFPNLGAVDDISAEFGKLVIAAAADQLEHASRIAYGIIATRLSTDRNESYSVLDELLSNVKVSPDSKEFLYQVNLPRDSHTDKSVMLNRLGRWSALVMKQVSADDLTSKGSEIHSVRVELDINTAQGSSLLNVDKEKLLTELINEGNLMLVNGDK